MGPAVCQGLCANKIFPLGMLLHGENGDLWKCELGFIISGLVGLSHASWFQKEKLGLEKSLEQWDKSFPLRKLVYNAQG